MVTLRRTWTPVNNQTFSANIADTQIRELFFAYYQLFQTAGWTVDFSTDDNSTTVFTAGDNIASAAAIALATAPNGAGFIVSPPANWVTGGALHLLFMIDDTTGTPQVIDCYVGRGGVYTPGALGVKPSYSGNEDQFTGTGFTSFLPWSGDGTNGRYFSSYSSRGDVRLMVRPAGSSGFRNRHQWQSNFDGEFTGAEAPKNGFGDYRFHGLSLGGSPDDGITASNLQSLSNNFGVTGDGVTRINPVMGTRYWDYTSFDAAGEVIGGYPAGEIGIGSNGAGAVARDLGLMVDLWGVHPLANFDQPQDGDADSQRLITIGDLWEPLDSTDWNANGFD